MARQTAEVMDRIEKQLSLLMWMVGAQYRGQCCCACHARAAVGPAGRDQRAAGADFRAPALMSAITKTDLKIAVHNLKFCTGSTVAVAIGLLFGALHLWPPHG